jgi:hypothetical protein
MMKMQFEAEENEKDRQANILQAEIRSAGYGSMMDIDKNQQSDYQDALENIQKQENYQQQMGLERDKEINKTNTAREQLRIKEQEISAKERIAEKQVEIARMNKNKYDVKQPKK